MLCLKHKTNQRNNEIIYICHFIDISRFLILRNIDIIHSQIFIYYQGIIASQSHHTDLAKVCFTTD